MSSFLLPNQKLWRSKERWRKRRSKMAGEALFQKKKREKKKDKQKTLRKWSLFN